MVILSCLAKKNQNLNLRKKSLLLKVAFSREKRLQTSLFQSTYELKPSLSIKVLSINNFPTLLLSKVYVCNRGDTILRHGGLHTDF